MVKFTEEKCTTLSFPTNFKSVLAQFVCTYYLSSSWFIALMTKSCFSHIHLYLYPTPSLFIELTGKLVHGLQTS